MKIITAAPGDDEEDIDLDIWAGVFSVISGLSNPVTEPDFTDGTDLPSALRTFRQIPENP